MLCVDRLRFSFPDSGRILHGISFELGRGSIVGLLGDNGAGKTTLIRCLCGLYPFEGSVTLDGKCGEAIKGDIAYVTGEGASVGELTPLQTGEFLAEFYPRWDAARYQKLLAYFELPEVPIRNMSKGEQAKAELAAGLCRGVAYILMDEPFSGKDVFTRRDFLGIMAGSLREDETLLLSTHLVSEVEQFLDRVLVLHEGELKADVEMDALRESGETLLTLLAEKTGYDETRAARIFAE